MTEKGKQTYQSKNAIGGSDWHVNEAQLADKRWKTT